MIRKGQGPRNESPLLIGDGRLARHLRFYLTHLGQPLQTWSRRDSVPLKELLSTTDRVWLAISDSALPGFIDSELAGFQGSIVHFSGAFHHPRAIAAHPLMTFSEDLYEPAFYRGIHFAVTGAADLQSALPGFPNPWFPLEAEMKPLYHALCVLGGNLPVLMWAKAESGLNGLGVPSEALRAYVGQVAENYMRHGKKALTGPIARGDEETIRKNLESLAGDPWQHVYQAIREAAR